MAEGWSCPSCGRCYAPWVYMCAYCTTVTIPATGPTYPMPLKVTWQSPNQCSGFNPPDG